MKEVAVQEQELSDLVREEATIVDVKLIQQGGDEYNQQHVDELVRWGFLPSDTVYELIFEFRAGMKHYPIRLDPDLKLLMFPYKGVASPEQLKGKQAYCLVEGSIFQSSIRKVEPL